MAIRLAGQLTAALDGLRYEPVDKRIRVLHGGRRVADTVGAVLVWEPHRVVPQYAVPVADVTADLRVAGPDEGDRHGPASVPGGPGGREVLTPATGFGVHTADGVVHSLHLGDDVLRGTAFRPADPDLAGYAVLDFAAFDTWLEEDEEIVSHPRDPFHRVDVRHSSRHVRVELDGHVLADSTRPSLVFETSLPVRYYLPAEDVDASALRPSTTTTACAYKGVASYRDVALPDRTVPDLVWTYPAPLPDAVQVTDLLCFFTERVDLVLDGVRHDRTTSMFS
jgi:uncharacterized protein (DUF427 family)